LFSFILKKALKNIVLRAAHDKNFRNKVKNTAYSGLQSAKNIKSNGEIMKTLGEKAGKLKKKIKSL
jgi:hypothetical protein